MKKLVCLFACSPPPSAACKKKSTREARRTGERAPDARLRRRQPTLQPPCTRRPRHGTARPPLSIDRRLPTPESVLYDADTDVYLVSNINGKPLDVDDNGYIIEGLAGRQDHRGEVDRRREGQRQARRAEGHGDRERRALRRRHQHRAHVRREDRRAKGDIKIDGATFLNDIAAGPDGSVYVTDSGLDAKFDPTGTDAVYTIGKDGKVKPLIKDKDARGTRTASSPATTARSGSSRSAAARSIGRREGQEGRRPEAAEGPARRHRRARRRRRARLELGRLGDLSRQAGRRVEGRRREREVARRHRLGQQAQARADPGVPGQHGHPPARSSSHGSLARVRPRDASADATLVLAQRGDEFAIRVARRRADEQPQSRLRGSARKLGCAGSRGRRARACSIGGLGMGFTLRAALDVLPRDAKVTSSSSCPRSSRGTASISAISRAGRSTIRA